MASDGDRDRVLAWLLSPAGRQAADRARWRLHLPEHLVDDVVSAAAQRAIAAVVADGSIANVAGFATRLLQRGAQDLVRARVRDERLRRHLGAPIDLDDVGWAAVAEPEPGPLDDGRLGAATRQAVARHAARSVPAAAAALAVLAIRHDGAEPAEDCPQPRSRVGELEAATWAGLWYAGQRGCFPPPGGADEPKIRKRRERAARAVHEVLAAAAEEVR